MNSPIYIFSTAIFLASSLISNAAFAQTRPSIHLTPAQVQRFSHDLVRSSSQDFFAQGQEQLEREIGNLSQRQLFLQEGVLKISKDLQIQQDFSKFERPESLSPAN